MSDLSDIPAPPGKRNIGQFLAAASVVLSLLFVGWEIRQNTEIARSEANSRISQALNEWRLHMASDSAINHVFRAWVGGEHHTLTDADDRRLIAFLNALFGIYEDAFFASEYGVLGAAEWRRFENRPCVHFLRDPEWFRSRIQAGLSEEFVAHLESLCSS